MQKNGLIFVCDPHVASRGPGRRIDNYTETTIKKLKHISDFANKKRFIVFVVGDLFGEAQDTEPAMLTALCKAIRGDMPWYCLVGNHDKCETKLTTNTALSVLSAAGVIRVIKKNGCFAFDIQGEKIYVHCVPYGFEIPSQIRPEFQGVNILLTHHDLYLNKTSAYPNAKEVFNIKNCQIGINGHIHKTQKRKYPRGHTQWYIPGSMTRTAIDLVDHKPMFLIYEKGNISNKYIPINQDVFDMIGKIVIPKKCHDILMGTDSKFAELLKKESNLDIKKSARGDMIREDLLEIFEDKKTSKASREIIVSLLEVATKK